MPISKECEYCGKVKRCRMFQVDNAAGACTVTVTIYLCRPCARELGYAP